MAKMHEAIYDLLPEEQTQVSGIFEIHLTPPLQMRMNSVTRESSALSTGRGNSFLSLCETHTFKGVGSSYADSLVSTQVFGCAGRAMRYVKRTD